MIEITGVNLVKFVQTVYDLSQPQGLGYLHFEEGSLTEEQAKEIIQDPPGNRAVTMDYVKGRGCKMTVFRYQDRLFISDRWFDHNSMQLVELLKRSGAPDKHINDSEYQAIVAASRQSPPPILGNIL